MPGPGAGEVVVLCESCGLMARASEESARGRACPKCGTPLVIRGRIGAASKGSKSVLAQATELARQQRYNDAIDLLKPIFSKDEQDQNVVYALGYCFYKLRNGAQARAFLERAVKLGSQRAVQVLARLDARESGSLPPMEPAPESEPAAKEPEPSSEPPKGEPREVPEEPSGEKPEAEPEEPISEPAEAPADPEPMPVTGEQTEQAAGAPPGEDGQEPPEEPGPPEPELSESFPPLEEEVPEPPELPGAPHIEERDYIAEVMGERVFPWKIPPERLARIEEYREQGLERRYTCRCCECLNNVLRKGLRKDLKGAYAHLCVYPNLVMVEAREREGCLVKAIGYLPPWARLLLAPILLVVAMVTEASGLIATLMALVFAIPLLIIAIPLAVAGVALGAILFPFVYLLNKLFAGLVTWWLKRVASRILKNPKASYAVKQLLLRCPLGPRVWAPDDDVGEVMQVIRVDTTILLKKYSFVVVVQDNPLPERRGIFDFGFGVPIGRLLRKKRRLYVLAMEEDAGAADRAAREVGHVLGVDVLPGRLGRSGLSISTTRV